MCVRTRVDAETAAHAACVVAGGQAERNLDGGYGEYAVIVRSPLAMDVGVPRVREAVRRQSPRPEGCCRHRAVLCGHRQGLGQRGPIAGLAVLVQVLDTRAAESNVEQLLAATNADCRQV